MTLKSIAMFTCDWCGSDLDNGDNIACKSCHEDLEQEVADLRKENQELREKITSLEEISHG